MMDKKALLIQILEKLHPHRPSAEGILLLIHEQEVDDKLVDGVLHIIADALRTTDSVLAKHKLQTSQKLLEKLKEQEQQEIDQQDAELLLAELDDSA